MKNKHNWYLFGGYDKNGTTNSGGLNYFLTLTLNSNTMCPFYFE
jgi:hypothetical protein